MAGDVTSQQAQNPAGRRPILAIDVDGVLNAISRKPRPPRGWADTRVLAFRIRYNPDHGARLLEVAEATGAELTWCTTWEDLANEYIGPLVGLPELPTVPLNAETKAAALCAYADDRPFCWLDDEPGAARELRSCRVPHLVVTIRATSGLQPHDLSKAQEWLASLRPEAGRG